MASISEKDIQKVRESTDIISLVAETVVLKQRNGEFWGCCPFHQEKTPSFKVNPVTQLWYCFGCSSGGDVFSYVMKRENLEFPDAVRYLADRAHIELTEVEASQSKYSKRARLIAVCQETADFYHLNLMRNTSQDAQHARSYLASRGFNSDVCKTWQIGYAPGHGSLVAHLTHKGFTAKEMVDANVALYRGSRVVDRFYERVMFPIQDEFSKPIAFGGRIIGSGEPKYLNSQETPLFHKSKQLFGFNRAKEHIVSQDCAIIVEGYTDVIALHTAGVTHVVATLGTALTEQHIKLLSRFARKIIFVFDGDAAGQNAAERGVQFVDKTEANLLCVTLPDRLDPADFIAQRGVHAFYELTSEPRRLVEFVIDKRLAAFDLSIPEQRNQALKNCVEVLAPFRNTLLEQPYSEHLANALMIERSIVSAALKNVKTPAITVQKEYNREVMPDSGESKHPGGTRSKVTVQDARVCAQERELLSALVMNPEKIELFSERVERLEWQAHIHQVIADACLHAPAMSTHAMLLELIRQVLKEEALQRGATLEQVESYLAQVLSTVTTGQAQNFAPETLIDFILCGLELEQAERGIKKLKYQMSVELDRPDVYQDLFEQATVLQKYIRELEQHRVLIASTSA